MTRLARWMSLSGSGPGFPVSIFLVPPLLCLYSDMYNPGEQRGNDKLCTPIVSLMLISFLTTAPFVPAFSNHHSIRSCLF